MSPAKGLISVVEPDGVTLKPAADGPKSALDGIPKFVNDGNLSPDFYAVNTMQPPYQPSANKPAPEGDPAYANPAAPTTLPPQTVQTIGDRWARASPGLVCRAAGDLDGRTPHRTNFQYPISVQLPPTWPPAPRANT
jgi:phospholipase C